LAGRGARVAISLLDLVDYLVAAQVDDVDMAAAILIALLFRMSKGSVPAVRSDGETCGAEALGIDPALDGGKGIAGGGIGRLGQIKDGDRARVAVLKGGSRLRVGVPGMVRDVGASSVWRDGDDDGLAAGNRVGLAGAFCVDVGGHAQAVDHRVRRAVIGRVQRALQVDHQHHIVPPPAGQEVILGRGGLNARQQRQGAGASREACSHRILLCRPVTRA
jgi:hypothetical protein